MNQIKITRITMKKLVGIFASILFFVMLLSWLSLSYAWFYEDSIYLFYATSMIQDLDFNIINQVPESFGQIITKNYSHPAHHSVIQTPVFILLYFLDFFITKTVGNGYIRPYILAGTLLSFLGLIIGLIFTQKAAKRLDINVRPTHFILYLFSTALLYFSFFTVTTIEIFIFAFSAYALNAVLMLYQRQSSQLDGFSIGAALSMLVTAKITFIWFFAGGTYYVFASLWKQNRKFIGLFLLSSILVFLIAALKDLAGFGEIVFISHAMTVYASDYSWIDLYFTIKQGIFGEGGLFYSNPLYAVSLVGFIFLFFHNVKKAIILWLSLLLWMVMSYFQCVFLIGPILDDHYLGRTMLTSLPLMLIGLAYFDMKFMTKVWRPFKFLIGFVLIAWQAYTLTNYLSIDTGGHYAYALHKTVSNYDALAQYWYNLIYDNNHLLRADLLKFLIFVLLTTGTLFVIFLKREKLYSSIKIYLRYSSAILLFFCLLNLNYSKKNGLAYLQDKDLMNKITIGDHASVYSFVYISDSLRSQLYNSKDPELRKIIKDKHSIYLEKIQPHILQISSELKQVLEQKDLDYSFYTD